MRVMLIVVDKFGTHTSKGIDLDVYGGEAGLGLGLWLGLGLGLWLRLGLGLWLRLGLGLWLRLGLGLDLGAEVLAYGVVWWEF